MALTTNNRPGRLALQASRGSELLSGAYEGALLGAIQAIGEALDRVGRGELRAKADANNQTGSEQECSRKDETMYKYKFAYNGGGTRRDNMNFKFHCFIADGDAVEHHLYEAKKRGLVVKESEEKAERVAGRRPTTTTPVGILTGIDDTYLSAMPVIKVFSSTSGFGIPKEYFSYFFVLSPDADFQVEIKPLGFDKGCTDAWYFKAAGRFMKKTEIKGFFGGDSDTWRFYNRQAFLSKRRINQLVTVSPNDHDGKVVQEAKQEVRMVRMD